MQTLAKPHSFGAAGGDHLRQGRKTRYAGEMADIKARVIGVGFGPKYGDMICSILPTKAGVTLGIAWATQSPDPEKMLEGTGRVHRHVKLNRNRISKSPP